MRLVAKITIECVLYCPMSSAQPLPCGSEQRQLIDLGADPQLCKEVEIRRIETLLNMSSDNCKTLATLQSLAGRLTQLEQKSVRDKISELKELIAEGANLGLCCDRDWKKIGIFLAWSEEEIEIMDKMRRRNLAITAEWEMRPI